MSIWKFHCTNNTRCSCWASDSKTMIFSRDNGNSNLGETLKAVEIHRRCPDLPLSVLLLVLILLQMEFQKAISSNSIFISSWSVVIKNNSLYCAILVVCSTNNRWPFPRETSTGVHCCSPPQFHCTKAKWGRNELLEDNFKFCYNRSFSITCPSEALSSTCP